eukprot:c20560_g1_i1 orf=628-1962(+)
MKPSSLFSYTCAFMETFIDCSASMVPLWTAVMAGILIGWIWRPRWVRSVLRAIKSKPCNAWNSSGGRKIQRSWPALNAVVTSSTAKARWSKCSSMLPFSLQTSDTSCGEELVAAPKSPVTLNFARSAVGEQDLLDLHRRLHGREGGLPWDLTMERSAPGIYYQAWRRDPQDGPVEYKSRTVFEDANPELVKDFYWDDEFRLVWDDMLIYAKTLEVCMDTGADIVHWVRKFPFFCSDREYIMGRRIFEVEGTFFCVTKVVPYAAVPRREKPLRVDTYYSSWCIRAVESMKNKGQMTACEVMFFHAEDMYIPKQIVKIGARQGMWGCVRRMEPALRKYQVHRSTGKMLSQSARLAQLYTRMPPNFFKVCGSITPKESSDDNLENECGDAARLNEVVKHGSVNQGQWRWLIVGGAVVLACTLDRGMLGRAVIFGLARRFGRVNQRLP